MIDLVILGIVIESPCSAYDVTKVIELRSLNKWIKISNQSIYKNMPKLADKKYLVGKSTGNSILSGKTMYSITENGYHYFSNLMDKFSTNIHSLKFEFTPVLMNIDKVSNSNAIRIMERLKSEFKGELAEFSKKKAFLPELNPTASKIVDLYENLFSYVNTWMEEFEIEYKTENKLG